MKLLGRPGCLDGDDDGDDDGADDDQDDQDDQRQCEQPENRAGGMGSRPCE